MRTSRPLSAALLVATMLGSTTASAQPSLLVDCAGISIPSSGTNPPDVTRTSTATISAAGGYQFAFNPTVTGTGFLGLLAIGGPKSLAEVINGFQIGQQRVLFGAVRNPSGALPTLLDTEPVGGTFSGITVNLTLTGEILANGTARAGIRNITKPSGLGLNVNSGGLQISTWVPPAPVITEWQFEGNLQSVKESGAAPTSGPAKMRYLDDAAFGPILGGIGNEGTVPNPATPQGVTQAQSAFGLASSFGLPPIGGSDDTVYRTSPPRNAGDPTNSAKSRGLGLTVWPNTRDFWPEDRNGQWTFVWDLLIPAASWNAGGQVIPLIEDSQNNNSAADAFLRVDAGAAKVGYSVASNAGTATPTIQPDTWFRLALVVDHYSRAQSRLFVNGAFVGTTLSDWLYNNCKSTDPRWGDDAPGNPDGTVIPAGTWNGWGQFPSPWALGPNSAPTASTLSLFADITGQGQSVYIANLMFSDEAMSDTQVAALGGPNARGIVYLRPAPCPADFNQSGSITVQDIFDFLGAYFNNDAAADFNNSGSVTVQDIFDFLGAYFAGCP